MRSLLLLICFSLAFTASYASQNSEDTVGIIISQNSKYLVSGQELVITIQAIGDRSRIETLSVGGSHVKLDKDGFVDVKYKATGVGTRDIPVYLDVREINGEITRKEYTVEFRVGSAVGFVEADEQNFLYIGIDNPITILTPKGPEKLSVSIAGGGGSISKQGTNKYVARVSSVSDSCRVTVFVNDELVASKTFSSIPFPSPRASLGGRRSGEKILATELCGLKGLELNLPDLRFKSQFNLISYSINVQDDNTEKSFEINGNAFPSEVSGYLCQLKAGAMVTVEQIKAEGPLSSNVKLPALIYYIE
jgi:hypothetical protein